jgi:hypothetical protein
MCIHSVYNQLVAAMRAVRPRSAGLQTMCEQVGVVSRTVSSWPEAVSHR